MKKIDSLTEESITEFLESQEFHKQFKQLSYYKDAKKTIKNGNCIEKAKAAIIIPGNLFFWRDIVEKATLLTRERI